MPFWIWVLLTSAAYGQISLKKTDENEIFDASDKLAEKSGLDDLQKFFSNIPVLEDVSEQMKKNQLKFNQQSSENDMKAAFSSKPALERIPTPVLDDSATHTNPTFGLLDEKLLVAHKLDNDFSDSGNFFQDSSQKNVAIQNDKKKPANNLAEKTTNEMIKEFRKEKTPNASSDSKTMSAKIPKLDEQINAFLDSMKDGNAVEKSIQDLDSDPVGETVNLSIPYYNNSMSNYAPKIADSTNIWLTATVATTTTAADLNMTPMFKTAEEPTSSTVIWSNPQIFEEPLHITTLTPGTEILSVIAYSTLNNSIEFTCILPEVVFCATDLLSDGNYRLRVVYTASSNVTEFKLPVIVKERNPYTNWHTSKKVTIHFILTDVDDEIYPEISTAKVQYSNENIDYRTELKITTEIPLQLDSNVTVEHNAAFKTKFSNSSSIESVLKSPVFIFAPHFEHNVYNVFLSEGKNKVPVIVAIIYFFTHIGAAEPIFSVQSDPLQWFYVGEIESQVNANRLIVAVKIMLREDTEVEYSKMKDGQYKFQLQAKQGDFETSADINVEILTFEKKTDSAELTTVLTMTKLPVIEQITANSSADSIELNATNLQNTLENLSKVATTTTLNAAQTTFKSKMIDQEGFNMQITQVDGSAIITEATNQAQTSSLSPNIQNVTQQFDFSVSSKSADHSQHSLNKTSQTKGLLSKVSLNVKKIFADDDITNISKFTTTASAVNSNESTTVNQMERIEYKTVGYPPKIQLNSTTDSTHFENDFQEIPEQFSEDVPKTSIDFPVDMTEKQLVHEVDIKKISLEHNVLTTMPPGDVEVYDTDYSNVINTTDFQNILGVVKKLTLGAYTKTPITVSVSSETDHNTEENYDDYQSSNQMESSLDLDSVTFIPTFRNSNNQSATILLNSESDSHEMKLTTTSTIEIPVDENSDNTDNIYRNNSHGDEFFDKSFEEPKKGFEKNMPVTKIQHDTTVWPMDLTVSTETFGNDSGFNVSFVNDANANNDNDDDIITLDDNINTHVSTVMNTDAHYIKTDQNDTVVLHSVDTTMTTEEYNWTINFTEQRMEESIANKTNENFESEEHLKQNENEDFESQELEKISNISQLINSKKYATTFTQQSKQPGGETARIKISPGNAVDVETENNEKQLPETSISMEFKTPEFGKYVIQDGLQDGDILPDLDIAITANNMDPKDLIMVSVNSSAFEVIPRQMQPGKTVLLAVRDAKLLYREISAGFIYIKVTASQQTRSSISSSQIIRIVEDEMSSNQAPTFLSPEYDLHITEGSITGQKVGQIEARFTNHLLHGIITYQLIGPGSELFAVSGGTVSVSCPSALPCLDRERTNAYHLLAIATDKNGLNSAPTIVRIHIDDKNDNGPILEISHDEIIIANGRLTKPFVVKVKDKDIAPYNTNEVSTDGTAAAFISLEKMHDDIYIGRLRSIPATGTYQLEIIVRDLKDENAKQRVTVNVQVLNAVTRAHFKKAKYERTVNGEKLFKGNLILQPEMENAQSDALRFIILRNEPGWISVNEYSGNVIVGDVPRSGIVNGKYSISLAALNRTDGKLITETVLALTVISSNHMSKLLSDRVITKVLRKEMADTVTNRQNVEIIPGAKKIPITIIRNSICAIDEKLHYSKIDKNAISSNNSIIILDMKQLQQIRLLQFNVSLKDDASDSAVVLLFLSSDPVEVARQRKRQSQPRFIHPWRTDMNIIPVKLAENSPQGYTIISIPAYNPVDGTKITDLRLSGEMAQHFTVDGKSGDVRVATPFDFEKMEPELRTFDLIITAGEEPYDTVALLRVEIIDVDDNPPKLTKFGDYNFENLTIAENSFPGTTLFEVHVSDPDYLYGKTGVFSYSLSGNGAAHFQVKELNDTVAVIVSPAADLDREKVEKMLVSLKVTDSGGNSDSISAIITITDVNDNVPVFLQNEYKIEAVENWPAAMVLTKAKAEDNDKGVNACIRYSISPRNNQYFEIDPVSGLIRTKKALTGLARAQPYKFSVLATDQGIPPLSARTAVSVNVLEPMSLSRAGDDNRIHIVSPPVHFTLKLDENIPVNDHVYTVRAKIGGFNEQFGRKIKYSLTPVDNVTDDGWFTIDASSGDLFTLRKPDHKIQSAITVSL